MLKMSRKTPLCSVIDCPNSQRNKSGSTVFYFLPKDPQRVVEWTHALKEHNYNVVPAFNKILICSNHFTPDDFEANSKRLKTVAVPSIFPSPPKQADTLVCQVNNTSNEPLSKRFKVTSPCMTKEPTQQKTDLGTKNQICQNISTGPDEKSSTAPHMPTTNEVKHKSVLPEIKIHSVFISNTVSSIGTKNTEKETSAVLNKSESAENNHAPFTNRMIPSVSQVKGELGSQGKGTDIEMNVLPSSSVHPRLKNELETDESYNIKEEFLDIDLDASFEDVPKEDADSNDRQFTKLGYSKKIEYLKSLKQSLLEEGEALRKQDQEVSVELKQARKEIKRKKTEQKNLPQKEVQLLKKCFSNGQIRMLTGNIKSRWSLDDLAVAYTIASLSSRDFYLYLRTNLKYPLPALSNINRCYKSKYRSKK